MEIRTALFARNRLSGHRIPYFDKKRLFHHLSGHQFRYLPNIPSNQPQINEITERMSA